MPKAWFAVAAMMSSVGAQAAEAPFCAEIKGEYLRVFHAVERTVGVTAPVVLKKGKPIAQERFALTTRWFTLTDQALATKDGMLPPVPFRAVRIAGTDAMCTVQARDNLFAKPVGGDFLLRCLVDADGDGRFEGYQPRAELISYNVNNGAQGKATGITPPVQSFAAPVQLVQVPGLKDPDMPFVPRIVAQARVVEQSATQVVIERMMQVAMLPGGSGERFRSWAASLRWTIPLQPGTWIAPDGTQIELAKNNKAWTATAPAGWFAPPTLACGNAVVELLNGLALIGQSGLNVIPKPPELQR